MGRRSGRLWRDQDLGVRTEIKIRMYDYFAGTPRPKKTQLLRQGIEFPEIDTAYQSSTGRST
jgi:hypothetical protein